MATANENLPGDHRARREVRYRFFVEAASPPEAVSDDLPGAPRRRPGRDRVCSTCCAAPGPAGLGRDDGGRRADRLVGASCGCSDLSSACGARRLTTYVQARGLAWREDLDQRRPRRMLPATALRAEVHPRPRPHRWAVTYAPPSGATADILQAEEAWLAGLLSRPTARPADRAVRTGQDAGRAARGPATSCSPGLAARPVRRRRGL